MFQHQIALHIDALLEPLLAVTTMMTDNRAAQQDIKIHPHVVN